MTGATKSQSMTRGGELLNLLKKHPGGLGHKDIRNQLNISQKHLYFLMLELQRHVTVNSWREPGQKGGIWWYSLAEPHMVDPKEPAPYITATATLPKVSSRAQEAYKVVRQLQHRDARHLAHAGGYSYGYAAEMMAELKQAGAL